MKISVFTDGGSRGNPGVSGFGVVVYDDKKNILDQISKFIGIKTNNEAEYMALIEALYWIQSHQPESNISYIDFYSDSQLLVRQIQGIYKVKAVNIKPLYQSAVSLLQKINLPYSFHDILRDSNKLADYLANQAMDQKNENKY
jgi:ribonuclease HI